MAHACLDRYRNNYCPSRLFLASKNSLVRPYGLSRESRRDIEHSFSWMDGKRDDMEVIGRNDIVRDVFVRKHICVVGDRDHAEATIASYSSL